MWKEAPSFLAMRLQFIVSELFKFIPIIVYRQCSIESYAETHEDLPNFCLRDVSSCNKCMAFTPCCGLSPSIILNNASIPTYDSVLSWASPRQISHLESNPNLKIADVSRSFKI